MLKRTALIAVVGAAIALAMIDVSSAKDVSVGVVVKIGGIPWFNAMETGIKEKSKELGDKGFMVMGSRNGNSVNFPPPRSVSFTG